MIPFALHTDLSIYLAKLTPQRVVIECWIVLLFIYEIVSILNKFRTKLSYVHNIILIIYMFLIG